VVCRKSWYSATFLINYDGFGALMLTSMTAFARAENEGDWGNAVWEIRSVNHRYLDVNFKLPECFRQLEQALRGITGDSLSRGKVDCYLKYSATLADEVSLGLNQSLVKALLNSEKELVQLTGKNDSLALADILKWPGVLVQSEPDDILAYQPLLELFKTALAELKNVRKTEGKSLVEIISKRLQAIETLVVEAQTIAKKMQQSQKKRLIERFNELVVEADRQRVEQELALMLQKLDVSEELDRILLHCDAVQQQISKPGVVGRRLDFLMQELNREANTLASKAQDARLTNAAVELKVLIEQIREQVQNIE
jgi:uncharacterized protein (TIGR00255 family)